MTLPHTILAVLALYMAQLFLQETSRFGLDLPGIVGTRDDLPEETVLSARLERAKDNLREALPFFLGLALLALARDRVTPAVTNAAEVFLVARVLYVPAYATGVPFLRSTLWLLSVGALLAMALPQV